jgi:hypothetical protein
VIEASHSASIRLERRKRALPLIAVGAAVFSFGVTWIASRPEPELPLAVALSTPAPAPSAPPPSAATTGAIMAVHAATALPAPARLEAEMTTVQLTITAQPGEALLYLDGIMLSDNPYTARVRADHELHTVRASGIGLQTQERVVSFDRDHAVSFDLGLPRSSHPASRPSRKPPAPAAASSTVSSADPPAIARSPALESPVPARLRSRASDAYDMPLRSDATPRAIYDEDPYK